MTILLLMEELLYNQWILLVSLSMFIPPIIYKVFIHLRCSLSHYLQGFSTIPAGLALGFLRFTSSLAQKGRGEHEEYPVGRGRLEPVGVSWRHGLGEEISGKITPPPPENDEHRLDPPKTNIFFEKCGLEDDISFLKFGPLFLGDIR